MPRTLGVEEEFHIVDLKSRRLTCRAPELLDSLSNSYVAEFDRTGRMVWHYQLPGGYKPWRARRR